MIWHWAHLLFIYLTKCVCFFLTLKPRPYSWNSGLPHSYMVAIFTSFRKQLKVSLPKRKMLDHHLSYPCKSDISLFSCLGLWVQSENLSFVISCTTFTIRTLTLWEQGASFLLFIVGSTRESSMCMYWIMTIEGLVCNCQKEASEKIVVWIVICKRVSQNFQIHSQIACFV